ncbi:MAG: radical SAM family heme chaperone HemW [Synergistaceae bacterium]|nr:radical SAM family heme chaperone HemW [Synergistaceae bacterium]
MDKVTSLYLHVPFCESKCPYCAFSSAEKSGRDEEVYLDSIALEMALRAPDAGTLDTLYIGGGTPSVLSRDAWRAVIELLEKFFTLSSSAEVTVEANPSSLKHEHLELWRNWRVNRLSLGVQSFDDARLAFLGRIHSSHQAVKAVELSLSSGFSVSLDLMFGLPSNTPGIHEELREWAGTLRSAIELRPHHISVYQLTIEPDTPFDRLYSDSPLMSDGYVPYRYAQWFLPRLGYEQYEVASFALPGHESRHNLNYWSDDGYIGIGPSAWGCVNEVRYKNTPRLVDYAAILASGGDPITSTERLEGERVARQAAVLALRTRSGINWEKFQARYGKIFAKAIKNDLKFIPNDLISSDGFNTRLTKKGLRLGNAVWASII